MPTHNNYLNFVVGFEIKQDNSSIFVLFNMVVDSFDFIEGECYSRCFSFS